MGEHPIEVARRALFEAAALEASEDWQYTLRRIAKTLPKRTLDQARPAEVKEFPPLRPVSA